MDNKELTPYEKHQQDIANAKEARFEAFTASIFSEYMEEKYNQRSTALDFIGWIKRKWFDTIESYEEYKKDHPHNEWDEPGY